MSDDTPVRVSTGVVGLDEVLHGGLVGGRAYMVRGDAGTGKTILGYHFLTAADDDALYVALEESERDVTANAAGLGFDLSAVTILDLSPDPERFLGEEYSVFEPDEVEHTDVVGRIADALEATDYDRVFVDPLSHLRHLSPSDYQFRQEVAAMMSYLKERGTTVLFTTQPTQQMPDDDLQFLADGAIELRRFERGRAISVAKFRGSDFQSGSHTLRISSDGIRVYPELLPEEHDREYTLETLSSGVDELDDLLGGGIERGTVTMITGPTGVGKTITATHFAQEAAARGEQAAIYLFEESRGSFFKRSEGVGIPVEGMTEEGTLAVEAVEPLALSTDEFAHLVRAEVEERGAGVVLIDGTAGYRLSLHADNEDLVRELHALCRYLRNMGVTVILTEEIAEITGQFFATSQHISYLADNILFLRYYEVRGEIHKAVGVLKKRLGDFEPALRELHITSDGLVLGEPLENLRGVLTGTPEWED